LWQLLQKACIDEKKVSFCDLKVEFKGVGLHIHMLGNESLNRSVSRACENWCHALAASADCRAPKVGRGECIGGRGDWESDEERR
jgi:hypothetical protein